MPNYRIISKLKKLKELGASVELADIGEQILPDGTKLALPPIVFGILGTDPAKKTVLIYGHLDVQPAATARDDLDHFFILKKNHSNLFIYWGLERRLGL